MDLFDEIYQDVGCAVLSDMKFEPYRKDACEKVATMKLDRYPLRQFQEFAEYLFGERVSFSDYQDVKNYFSGKY